MSKSWQAAAFWTAALHPAGEGPVPGTRADEARAGVRITVATMIVLLITCEGMPNNQLPRIELKRERQGVDTWCPLEQEVIVASSGVSASQALHSHDAIRH
jgi:hypothetical protein